MDIFFTLFTNLIPLYILIALGFIAGRFLNVDRETIANLVIYMALPIVVFGFIVNLDLKPAYALLPVIIYIIATIVGFGSLALGKKIYGDNRANLLSLCTSMPNTGYFGLPLVLLLFDAQWVGVYMFMMLGITVYEATIGYYIAARGAFNVRESFIKLAKFPSIYAVTLGLAVNLSGFDMPVAFDTYWVHFKGVYVVMGMMIIGVALGKVEKLVIAPRFISLVFAGKFLLWPLLSFAVILCDRAFFNLFAPEVHRLIMVLSILPHAANIAAFAAQFDMRPEKAATTVLAGTIFALFYIPFIVMITGL